VPLSAKVSPVGSLLKAPNRSALSGARESELSRVTVFDSSVTVEPSLLTVTLLPVNSISIVYLIHFTGITDTKEAPIKGNTAGEASVI
jgi:hypothetical protein